MSAGEAEEAVHANREESFLLAVPEKRLLRWIAAGLPRWILPDDMTALGVVAALAVAVAYQPARAREQGAGGAAAVSCDERPPRNAR